MLCELPLHYKTWKSWIAYKNPKKTFKNVLEIVDIPTRLDSAPPKELLRNWVWREAMGRSGGTGRSWPSASDSNLWQAMENSFSYFLSFGLWVRLLDSHPQQIHWSSMVSWEILRWIHNPSPTELQANFAIWKFMAARPRRRTWRKKSKKKIHFIAKFMRKKKSMKMTINPWIWDLRYCTLRTVPYFWTKTFWGVCQMFETPATANGLVSFSYPLVI